jgi:hypothetical protein
VCWICVPKFLAFAFLVKEVCEVYRVATSLCDVVMQKKVCEGFGFDDVDLEVFSLCLISVYNPKCVCLCLFNVEILFLCLSAIM